MIYIISLSVFTGIILLLVAILIGVELAITRKGDRAIVINDDDAEKIKVKGTPTLLSALSGNSIFLPSACGGGGSCGMCKCVINKGGGEILPTELTHLSRKEKKKNVRIACQVKVKDDMKIEIPPEIFNIQKYSGTIVSNNNVATFIKEPIIKLDEGQSLDFESGTYIQIDIPEFNVSFSDFDIEDTYKEDWDKHQLWDLEAESDEPAFRAYSLASPPYEKQELRLTVRIATPPPSQPDLPPGIGSSFIFSLRPGDPVTLSGPYGDFLVQDTDREMCFIGGGAGMAPMRSHIFHQFYTVKTKRKTTFWYGARSKREIFYDDEFQKIEAENDNFSFYLALSSPLPEDNWEGLEGFIHEILETKFLESHEDPSEVEYYLCGPPLMIDAIIETLDSFGVEEEMIYYDKF